MKNAYIDVRGPWPVYIKGMIVIELRGMSREFVHNEMVIEHYIYLNTFSA